MNQNLSLPQTISQAGWTIPQIANCLKQIHGIAQLNEKTICCTLLAWVDEAVHVAQHATGRRFTRLQLIENSLSAAGFQLTQHDFDDWLKAQSNGDWRPNDLLPYDPVDTRLVEQEKRIDQLEHDLHQMEVARNRAKAELAFVQAERDHFLATASENIYKSVSADYQNSASWQVTKPLRKLMAWRRGEKFVEVVDQKPDADKLMPPWERVGYSVEKAWKAQEVEDFDRNDYAEWIRRYDSPSVAEVASLTAKAQALASLPDAPKFSLLMAVEQPNLAWLKEAVASVQAQIYPNWELCISVSSNSDEETRTYLENTAKSEQRIKLTNAAAADNLLAKAYEVATGKWICVLNAMNNIAIQAINTPTTAIFEHKNIKIIYTDSDKLAWPDFQRAQPNFKPDWNLDLFLSGGSLQHYTQDLCFFRADLVRELGGIHSNFDTSFDITLRALDHIEPSQIHHLPQVLVHVRENPAGVNHAAAEAFNKTFHQCLQYPLPTALPMVSLIIPTKNNVNLLRQCLESIVDKTRYQNYEILVVDNGSDQPDTLDYLKSITSNQKIRVIRDNDAFNFSAQNNYAVTFAKGEILGLINDDIEVKSADWLSEMVSHALRRGVGAVGARLWYPNGRLQHAGMVLVGGVARHVHKHLPQGNVGFNGRAAMTQNFSAVTGACLVVKKTLFLQVGGLNDQELAVGFNDVDFCLKLVEAGLRNVWTPYAELIHHESATRGQDHSPEKQRRAEKELRYMLVRWGERMHVDTAYNCNLTDGHDDMSFAWPPRTH